MSVSGGEYSFSNITQKIAEILALPNDRGSGVAGFSSYGDNALIVAATQQAILDPNGIRTKLRTTSVLNNIAGVKGDLQWRRDQSLAAYFRISLEQTSNCRVFFGLTDRATNMVDAVPTATVVNITANYFGIQFDSGVDTNWKFIRNDNAGNGTRSDTGIVASAGSILHLYLWTFPTASGNKIIAQLGHDTNRVQFVSDLPLNTANMCYECDIRTLAAVAKGIEIGKVILMQVY